MKTYEVRAREYAPGRYAIEQHNKFPIASLGGEPFTDSDSRQNAEDIALRWNAHLPLLNALTGHLAGAVPDVVRTQQRDMIARLLRSAGAKEAIMERLEQWNTQDVIDRFGLSCEPGHVQQLHAELREALDHPQELIDWTIHFNLLQP